MFCWGRSRSDPEPSANYHRNSIYDSVFTYNTERQFHNNYSPFAQDTADSDYSNEDLPLLSKILEVVFMVLSGILVVCTLPFSLFFCIKFVGPFERLVVMRLGHSQGAKGPGTVFVFPFVDTAVRIDIRVQSFELPAFQMITLDRGLVEVAIVIFSRVVDPLTAHCGVQNREETLRSLAYNITYNNLVKRNLSELTDPDALARLFEKSKDELNHSCKSMGLEVTQVTVHHLKVVKPAENPAVSLFNTIMKSELGEQLINNFGPQLKSYFAESLAAANTSSSPAGDIPSAEHVVLSVPTPAVGNDFDSIAKECVDAKMLIDFDEDVADQFMDEAELLSESMDADIVRLIRRVRACCDGQLVAQVGKRYLIHVLADVPAVECDGEADGAVKSIGALILDLSVGEGTCHWLEAKNDTSSTEKQISDEFCAPHAAFSLRKATLLALVEGTISPLSAYLNGAVEISIGSVADAMPLKHLAERATKST